MKLLSKPYKVVFNDIGVEWMCFVELSEKKYIFTCNEDMTKNFTIIDPNSKDVFDDDYSYPQECDLNGNVSNRYETMKGEQLDLFKKMINKKDNIDIRQLDELYNFIAYRYNTWRQKHE